MNSAELSATDIGHSTSTSQTHAAFIDFTAEIKILNYFPLLLMYITSNFLKVQRFFPCNPPCTLIAANIYKCQLKVHLFPC